MGVRLRVLVPEATTNYVTNPSFEFDTTGWTATGSSIAKVQSYARHGNSSLSVITTGVSIGQGVYCTVSGLSGSGKLVTASVYVRGTGKVKLRLVDTGAGGTNFFSDVATLDTSRWTRLEVTGRTVGSAGVRLYVETASSAQAVTFYVDGAQMETLAYPTTYCDGDQPGCRWNVYSHASVSTRDAANRVGGRWITLADECNRDMEDLYITTIGGLGSAPVSNNTQSYGDAPGSYYQNTKTNDRVVTMVFNAVSPDLGRKKDVTRRDIHWLRKTLWDIIRPDKTAGGQEFLFEYTDGDIPLYFWARYDTGMEGDWDIRNRLVEDFAVRFICVQPYMFDDNQNVSALDLQDSLAIQGIVARIQDRWTNINWTAGTTIHEIAIDSRGKPIFVGNFAVREYNGTTLQHLGGTARNLDGATYDVAVAPNGDLWFAGAFSNISTPTVASGKIARWINATQAWDGTLGTPISNTTEAIAVAPNGDVYIGGNFTTAGGVNCRYIARRTSAGVWQAIGAEGGLNNIVRSISISADGSEVYIGGDFTDEYGSPGNLNLSHVALYTPSTNQFYELGEGFDATVRKIAVSKTGRIYAGGDFTLSGDQPMLYIAYWNGSAWFGLGAGMDNNVYDISIDDYGNILVSGIFSIAGSTSAPYIAYFNGSTWVNLDVHLSSNCYAVEFGRDGIIWAGAQGTSALTAGITTIDVDGTAETSPTITITGPCTFRWLENQTTKKRIYADLDILSGETITMELGTGRVTSSSRGDISYAIYPGSDLRAWTLIPGENKISALVINAINPTMYLRYQARYWGVDGTVSKETL